MALPDLKSLQDAVRLRVALSQTDSYLFGPQASPTPTTQKSTGPLPLIAADGRSFARKLLKNKQTLTLAQPVKTGTVIEYRGDRMSQFGVVTNQQGKSPGLPGIYVNPIDAQDATKLLTDNPDLVHLTVTPNNAVVSQEYSSLTQPNNPLDFFIDPLDRFIFRLQLGILGHLPESFTPDQVLIAEFILGILLAVISVICLHFIAAR